ncbi:tRNA (adenosine(37)-N6)-threonylcarbamoyltransferase complex dimerization subunit type 1 TsaB [Limnohabitans sp. 2KL-51]|jgi:tRNA threonylcarbamoyladenosine biosynthesis protein TsaB|uniref:tRNA (adenosine(37)-N6)-threonylcarbamoyltransferase complex dimerization subunit type 1 TsaB n=1 Tax=Limnohabitans sp. 2KL-51 TaxID=1977911 RepID=UPI000D3B6600|nr:tRNA (adenosine(37)-N6)-threonylcarbamoyltransferase complex dimerization subunit type 1 TsaB [Limnohabitans sp. 2KL-51]PUE44223.1 tRNA (adenosine(37)-N6)-threonylcarbamoyltransferase complex dimerization subunit type 1 TsaB [Limnohabitans sp. 2KL-51]
MSTSAERRWLAFDTSTDVLSLAVARGEQVWGQTLPGGAQASSGLIPAVLALLAEADMPLSSLDAIVFGRGPGSFTGLRTACAVAQGLAFGVDLPVLPVDTLLAVAEEARWAQVHAGAVAPDTVLTVLALLDARMDEVYSAAYHWEPVPGASLGRWQEALPLQVGAPERLQMPDDRVVLQAGNAFAAYGDRLPRVAAGGLRCEALPTAAALLRLAPALWAQGLAVPAEQAMPLYIRDKVANTTAEREAMKAHALQAQAALAKAAAQPLL